MMLYQLLARMQIWGIEDYLLAGAVVGIQAQDLLAKRYAPAC